MWIVANDGAFGRARRRTGFAFVFITILWLGVSSPFPFHVLLLLLLVQLPGRHRKHGVEVTFRRALREAFRGRWLAVLDPSRQRNRYTSRRVTYPFQIRRRREAASQVKLLAASGLRLRSCSDCGYSSGRGRRRRGLWAFGWLSGRRRLGRHAEFDTNHPVFMRGRDEILQMVGVVDRHQAHKLELLSGFDGLHTFV